MRVFILSDLHVDYSENALWVSALSSFDYTDDVLILAGDISDNLELFSHTIRILANKFLKVLFVPGNHEFWIHRCRNADSFKKFEVICKILQDNGGLMKPFHYGKLSIVPLFSWYDYSFAKPTPELLMQWMDFSACCWNGANVAQVTDHFCGLNEEFLGIRNETLISFSHFLPRIDVLPEYIPDRHKYIFPVLGSTKLEHQVRKLDPDIHIYGHSHINRDVCIDGIRYVNNAFGNPGETRISGKQLVSIFEL